jgi:hypothetical protein
MNMRVLFALVIVALGSVSANAQAGEYKVGTTAINFTAPSGQCERTGATRAETVSIEKGRKVLSRSHHLVTLYADCDQLQLFREGRSGVFQDFSQYIVQLALVNRSVPAEAVSDVCDAAKKFPAAKIEDVTKPITSKRLDESWTKFNEPKFLGVIAEEPGACYTGTVARISSGSIHQLQVGVVANVVVKGKFITYPIYALYRGPQSLTDLLDKHKANVAAFIAANAP